METVNPANGQAITTLPRSTSDDVELATAAALEATQSWSATTMEQRIAWLHRIADALEEDAETIAQLESMDTGKPISLARRWTPPVLYPISDFSQILEKTTLNQPLLTTVLSTMCRPHWMCGPHHAMESSALPAHCGRSHRLVDGQHHRG